MYLHSNCCQTRADQFRNCSLDCKQRPARRRGSLRPDVRYPDIHWLHRKPQNIACCSERLNWPDNRGGYQDWGKGKIAVLVKYRKCQKFTKTTIFPQLLQESFCCINPTPPGFESWSPVSNCCTLYAHHSRPQPPDMSRSTFSSLINAARKQINTPLLKTYTLQTL